jgi:hypothetical protein
MGVIGICERHFSSFFTRYIIECDGGISLNPIKFINYSAILAHGDSILYWDIKATPEDEKEMIRKIAEKIHQYDLDLPAILMIESFKPLSFIGTQMGRFVISPFLPIFGKNIGISGEKFLQIFGKRDNVEKLIKAVEKLTQEEEEQKKVEKAKKLERKSDRRETGEASKNKGWRRFLPF